MIKKSFIYYELDDGRSGYITPFTYSFLKHKVFRKMERKNFLLLKENVSKIHFNNWELFNELSLNAKDSDAEIIINNIFGNYFYVDNSKKTKLIFTGEDGNEVLCADFVNADSVFFRVNGQRISDLRCVETESVSIYGESFIVDNVYITSKNIEYKCNNNDIKNLSLCGDKVKISNSNGKVKSFYTRSENFSLESSGFESKSGVFYIKNIPVIKDSLWLFNGPIRYNDSNIGKIGEDFLLDDDTFSKDKCFDVARAYVSFVLSKVKEKIEEKIDDKYDLFYMEVAKDLKDLKAEYDAACKRISEIAVDYDDNLQNCKVKQYVKKN